MNTSVAMTSTANVPASCSVSAINALNGDVCKLRIKQNSGTTTVYSNGAVSGSTQGLSYEVS